MHSWRWLTCELQPAAAAAAEVAVSCYLVELRQLWCVINGFKAAQRNICTWRRLILEWREPTKGAAYALPLWVLKDVAARRLFDQLASATATF
jgi:hypothetical protein